jgi:hypothetical protein
MIHHRRPERRASEPIQKSSSSLIPVGLNRGYDGAEALVFGGFADMAVADQHGKNQKTGGRGSSSGQLHLLDRHEKAHQRRRW